METGTMTNGVPHAPWERWAPEDRERHLNLTGARPVRWTLDPEEHGTLTEGGCVLHYLGASSRREQKVQRVRADGKADRRAAGLRKCGNCGQSGHNRRTCRAA